MALVTAQSDKGLRPAAMGSDTRRPALLLGGLVARRRRRAVVGALGEHRSAANQLRLCLEVTNATYFAAAGGRAGTVAPTRPQQGDGTALDPARGRGVVLYRARRLRHHQRRQGRM